MTLLKYLVAVVLVAGCLPFGLAIGFLACEAVVDFLHGRRR
jgi:hypothetical protein